MKASQKSKVKSQKRRTAVVLLLFIFSFLILNYVSAQQPTHPAIKKSEKTETIDGKKFYIHTVEKGQTLYSIAKAYGTTVDIVLANNPDAIDGLKANQKLKIPFIGQNSSLPPAISEEKKKVTPPISSEQEKKTLPVITKKDSVKSPTVESIQKTKVEPTNESHSEEITAGKPIENIHVGVFLPLSLAAVDAIDVGKIAQGEEQFPQDVKSSVEFYEGLKLAMDSLKKEGIKGNIQIYDTNLDSTGFAKLMKKPELKNLNLIISTLHGKRLESILHFAKENNIFVVAPAMQSNTILMGNNFVSKVTPSFATQADMLGSYVAEKFTGQNIILFNSANPKDKPYINTFRKSVNEGLARSKSDSAKEATLTTLKNFISKTKPNIVVIPSTNQSFVTEAVNKLFLDKQENKDSIIAIGMSNWLEYESLDFGYLNSLHAIISAFQFVDYNSSATKKFIQHYRDEYKTEPNENVYSGFDVCYFYMNGLSKFGTGLQKKLPELKKKGLQTEFNFIQSDLGSGYENKGVGIMQYDNYAFKRMQ